MVQIEVSCTETTRDHSPELDSARQSKLYECLAAMIAYIIMAVLGTYELPRCIEIEQCSYWDCRYTQFYFDSKQKVLLIFIYHVTMTMNT